MAELPIADRALVRDFLVKRFSLAELKELAFDVGINPDELESNTSPNFARDLLGYCERRASPSIGCLLGEIAKRRPDDMMTRLANAQGSFCQRLLQFILPGSDPKLAEELLAAMKAVLQKHPDANVQVLGVLPGSVRVLVSMPENLAPEFLSAESEVRTALTQRITLSECAAFEDLAFSVQEKWRDEVYRRIAPAPIKPRAGRLPAWATPPVVIAVVIGALVVVGGGIVLSLPKVTLKNNCAIRIPPPEMGQLPLIGALEPGGSATITVVPGTISLTSQNGLVAFTVPSLGTLPQRLDENALGNVLVDGRRLGTNDTVTLELGSVHTVVLCAGGR